MRWLTVALILASGQLAVAQTVSGVITGAVKDPTEAVILNANVTLTNEATDARRTATTNEAGLFTFNSVQPGSYTLRVEQAGFKAFLRTHIVLTAGEHQSIEMKMELGASVETVRVESQGATVNTVSAERAGVVTASQLETLQLKGRDYMGMVRLLPGVVDTKNRDAPGFGSNGGLNIQGGRGDSANITLDGVTNADAGNNTGNFFAPSMDAVAEVKVLLTNYQAEYGRNAGASINVIMKAGTKDFHGSAYEYKRNEALNANNFFNNLTGLPRARYRYDIYGYTLGGPLYIPHLFNTKKEKLFFFFSHELSPQTSPQPVTFRTVPTALERRGDYSQTFLSNNALQIITDPTTNKAFPDNVIPVSRLDKNGQALLNLFPLPNTTSATRQYNYVFQSVVDHPRNTEVLRIDYLLDSKTTLFWRGILSSEQYNGDQGFTGISSNWGQTPMNYNITGKGSVANLTRVISPNAVNEFTWGVNRGVQKRFFLNADALARNQRSTTNLSGLGQFYPQNNPQGFLPDASFGGVPNAVNLLMDPKFPFLGNTNIWNYTDNFSYVHASHTFKAGLYFEPTSRNTRRESLFRGSFDFSSDSNNPLNTGWAWASAALGTFKSYQESDSPTFAYGRFMNLEWYVQDSWKVSRRLTLDLGLRFCILQPAYSATDNLAGFVINQYSASKAPLLYRPAIVNGTRVGVDPRTGATVPSILIGAFVPNTGDVNNGMLVASQDKNYPRGLIDNRGVNYAPRIGFAYDVFGTGKTAVRGGFGIFYNRIGGDQAFVMTQNPPLRNTPIVYYNSLNTYLQAPQLLSPTSVFGLSKSGEVPTAMNWSLGIQHSLGFGTVVDIAYVGSVARHLLQGTNINQLPYGTNFLPSSQDATSPGKPLPSNFLRPYAGYGDIEYRDFSGTSNFHSLQVQVNRRFARSLQYGLTWTWSKTMDYVDEPGVSGSTFSDLATYVPIRVWNYGKAGFDRTHNVVFSYTWDIPKLSPHWNNGFTRQAFDNWQLSGITSFVSGAPMGITLTTTDSADIAGGGDGVRAVMLANPVLGRGDRTFYQYFNTSAFGRPKTGTYGNAPKDVFRGPGINNWDISISKKWPIASERRRLEFRLEFYNAWNHTQFSAVDSTARFAPDGSQTNLRFGQLTAANPARQLQASLRFAF